MTRSVLDYNLLKWYTGTNKFRRGNFWFRGSDSDIARHLGLDGNLFREVSFIRIYTIVISANNTYTNEGINKISYIIGY